MALADAIHSQPVYPDENNKCHSLYTLITDNAPERNSKAPPSNDMDLCLREEGETDT